jgi:hypothetical protein
MNIKKILEEHKLWLETGGKEGARANLRYADFYGADLIDANFCRAYLSGARGIIQWQAPQGERRICYSVKYDYGVMHKLGCFWGSTDEAVKAIRKKYGQDSLYEQFLLMQVKALQEGE